MILERRPQWILILVLLLASAVPSMAQYATSTISGIVGTEDGRPIADVQIQWTQNGRTIFLPVDSSGEFCFYFATPGRHTLTFQHSSSSEVGTYEALVGAGSVLRLAIILHSKSAGDGRPGAWEIKEQETRVREVWPPERVLTENRIASLPSTEHLGSFLNHTEPSIVADRFDISGLNSNSQLLLGVRGSSWTQNQASLNGLSVTHPSGEGMLLFPDMTGMEAIIYTVGDSPNQHTGSGAHLAFLPKSGERQVHGQAQVFFQCGALQNSNVTPRYRHFGITESDERWRHLVNGNLQLGGPIGRWPWTYFGSVSVRDLEKRIRNHALPVSARVSQVTLNLSGQLSPRDQLGFYGSTQQLLDPQAGSSPQVTRESSVDQKRTYYAGQGFWTRYLSTRSLLDVRFGGALGDADSKFQPGIWGQSREDLFPGYALAGLPDSPSAGAMIDMLSNTSRGPAPLVISSDAGSLEGSAIYSTVREGFWKFNHRVSIGTSFRRSYLTQRYSAIDGVNLLFFQGAPNSVRIINTPAQTRDRVSQLEWYGTDSLSLARWTLAAGASLDSSQGGNLLSSGQSANTLRWTNFTGRLGAAYQIWNQHPLVLHAGLARIYDQPIASIWSAVNPEGIGVRLYSWADANGDQQFQTGENGQILKVYGAPYTTLDPSLKNPRTTEVTVGITQAGTRGTTFQLLGFRRDEHQLISLVNEGVPFSSYTPVQVPDPGPDGAVATADDRWITVFNQKVQTLGQDRYLLTNPDDLSGYSEGLQVKFNFSYSRFQAEAALTRYRAVATTAPGLLAQENDTSAYLGAYDGPNNAILAKGSTFFDRGTMGRIWATSRIAWKLRGSLIANYQDGLPYSRYLPIQGLNQGVIGVLTTQRGPGDAGSSPGSRTAHYLTIDGRFLKDFSLGPGKLVAILDVFNLANSAQPMLQTYVTAPTQYWRVPLRFETPRSLQLGIRFTW